MRVLDSDTHAREAIVVDDALESLCELAHVLPTLQHLNVSAVQLRNLNITHNAIASLQEIALLSHLRVLKCSHNEIADLSWLRDLHALQELFVQHNRIERAQIAHLQTLHQLTTLVLHPNPCTEQPTYVVDVVRALPWLERLDLTVVDDTLRASAQHDSEREALSTGSADYSLTMLTGRSDGDGAMAATSVTPTRSSMLAESLPTPEQPLEPVRKKKTKQEIAEEFMRNFPVQEYIPTEQQLELDHPVETSGVNDGRRRHSSDPSSTKSEAFDSLAELNNNAKSTSQLSDTSDESESTHASELERQGQDRNEETSSADSHSEPSPPPPTGISSIASAVLSLPTFSSDGFLKKHAPKSRAPAPTNNKKQPKRLKNDTVAHSVLPSRTDTNAFEQDELTIAYPNSTVTAVHVRSDGSALAKWPNGSVAVSVDRERDGFRVYAAHKDGAIALSLDAAGVGFINFYPSGRTMLSTTSSGDGLVFSSDGAAIVRQWDVSRRLRDEQFESTDALGSEDDGSLLCKLSDGIGVRVQLAEPCESSSSNNASCSSGAASPIQLSVYFATTSGIRYRFTNSVNVVGRSTSDACDCVFGPLAAASGAKRESAKALPAVPHADLLHDIRAAVASLSL